MRFPPPPVEVGYQLGRWRYAYRRPDGTWHTRDTRRVWFQPIPPPDAPSRRTITAVTAPLYWLLAAVIIAMVMLVVWWLTPGIIAILWLIGLLAVAAILNAVRVRSRR